MALGGRRSARHRGRLLPLHRIEVGSRSRYVEMRVAEWRSLEPVDAGRCGEDLRAQLGLGPVADAPLECGPASGGVGDDTQML